MDRITIDDLQVYAYHGVFDFEKEKGQNFYISAVLYLNTQLAGLSDNLADTVSYAEVCDEIIRFNNEHQFDLIETVAEELAVCILNKWHAVQEIELTVSKPDAPINGKAKNLSVTVERKRHITYIAYGSNMGDSKKLIADALESIDNNRMCNITKKSSMVISKPYGGVEQDDFYNGVVELETYLEPESLLYVLNTIEKEAGRVRNIHWGPRTLDLDIILYDDMRINTAKLTVPHKDMCNRDFVLGPLAEIAGYRRVPGKDATVEELFQALKERYIK